MVVSFAPFLGHLGRSERKTLASAWLRDNIVSFICGFAMVCSELPCIPQSHPIPRLSGIGSALRKQC
jgi:hypothetical protein